MKINLSTNLLGLDGIFSTYGSNGDPEYTLKTDIIDYDFKEGYIDYNSEYFWDHFDNSEYMDRWNDAIQSYLKDDLLDNIFSILNIKDWEYEDRGHWSPREYNFHCDENLFTIIVDDKEFKDAILKYIEPKTEKFEAFLRKHFSSRSGFMSFTSNNLNDWMNDFREGREQEIGAVLMFIIKENNLKESAYYVFEDFFYSEFVNTTDLDYFLNDPIEEYSNLRWQNALLERGIKGKFVPEDLKIKIQSLYLYPKEQTLDILIKELDYKNNEYFIKYLSDMINLVYSEIESKTLKLEL